MICLNCCCQATTCQMHHERFGVLYCLRAVMMGWKSTSAGSQLQHAWEETFTHQKAACLLRSKNCKVKFSP